MIDLVNPKLPKDQQVPLIGNRYSFYAVRRRYRELFLDSKHLNRLNGILATGLISFVAAILVLVFVIPNLH